MSSESGMGWLPVWSLAGNGDHVGLQPSKNPSCLRLASASGKLFFRGDTSSTLKSRSNPPMPLSQFWKTAREAVLKMTIEQVVSSAGDGILLDQSPCSDEFRQYLNVAPIERLFDYSRHCLESSFNKSGLVLQDIVNEFGRRLDFEVENGLYQGKRNAVGFDGIWRAKGEPDLIIEVKTTD
jgi:hypothetical protein